jgi:aryl-alcohol dehydrogenase-like predicted oxidoreductase
VRRRLEDRLGLDRVDIALIHDPDDFMSQAADEAYPRWPNSAPRAQSAPWAPA